MKVEDLAKSLSKSIQKKVDAQHKLIANQNVELVILKYEKERIASELSNQKELNHKLQQSLEEQKFLLSNQTGKKLETEESAMRIIIIGSDLDQDKRRIRTLEQENNELNDKLFIFEKEKTALKEKISQMEIENRRICEELNLLIRKNDRNKKTDFLKNFDNDLLYNVSNISKLQASISLLKQRENLNNL